MLEELDPHGDAWIARLRRDHERHAGIPALSHEPGARELDRDRAQEARYGGRLYRMFANDPRYRLGIDGWARSYARELMRPRPHQVPVADALARR